jgi:hypothetical protein
MLIVTSPKSTSASLPGRWVCGKNTLSTMPTLEQLFGESVADAADLLRSAMKWLPGTMAANRAPRQRRPDRGDGPTGVHHLLLRRPCGRVAFDEPNRRTMTCSAIVE